MPLPQLATIIDGMAAEDDAAAYGDTPPVAAAIHFPILLAAALSVSMAYGVTLPILPFIIERTLDADAAAVAWHTGALTGLYTFTLFVLSSFWGAFSDRIGKRPVITIGLIGSSAGLLLLDSATTLPALYLARGVSGALSAAVLPAVLALVAEASQASERPRKFAIISSATTLGFLLGPILGSWLSPMVLAPLAGMRIAGFLMLDSPFFAVALTSLLITIPLIFLRAHKKPYRANATIVRDSLNAADQSGIILGLLLTGITVFGITIAEVGITLLGKEVLSLQPEGIVKFFLLCSVVMILVQIGVFPLCMQRFALPSLIAASLLVVSAGLVLIAFARSSESVMLAFALVSIGTAILIPALATLISEAAGPTQGKAMGRQASAANLGQALAASLTGALFLVTPGAPFLAGAAVAAFGLLLAYQLHNKR